MNRPTSAPNSYVRPHAMNGGYGPAPCPPMPGLNDATTQLTTRVTPKTVLTPIAGSLIVLLLVDILKRQMKMGASSPLIHCMLFLMVSPGNMV